MDGERLSAGDLDRLRGDGVVVVDTRDRHAFAAAHVPASANIELDGEVGAYMGRLWPAGTRFAFVTGAGDDLAELARQCAGMRVEGVLGGGIAAWADAGLPLASYPVTDVAGMAEALGSDSGRALDVRGLDEWREGRVPGAVHVPIDDVPVRLGELGRDRPVYVYCRSGRRASIGAGLLDGAGVPTVLVDGGFPDWRDGGRPVEKG